MRGESANPSRVCKLIQNMMSQLIGRDRIPWYVCGPTEQLCSTAIINCYKIRQIVLKKLIRNEFVYF